MELSSRALHASGHIGQPEKVPQSNYAVHTILEILGSVEKLLYG
jgi:hypothetical protein